MVRKVIILRKRNVIKDLENLGFHILYAENDKIILEPKDSNKTLSIKILNQLLPGWEKEEILEHEIKNDEMKSIIRVARRKINANSNSN